MEPVPEISGEPITDYCLSWDDAGRCSLYPTPKPGTRKPPVVRKGPRVTTGLSANGVRTIRGAVMKAARLGFPIKVMWTFTVKEKDEGGTVERPREAVASGALILSEELRRTLAALWHYRERQQDARPFHNVWAAENPPAGSENERNGKGHEVEGTRNPHIHLLTNWTFEAEPRRPKEKKKAYEARALAEFVEFAAYVESLWGLGWVHMEFLDNPLAAGAYLLKAAGYITKGAKEQEPQPVRGQRWYVSDGIRPVKESKAVELDPETVRKLHALRYQAKDSPMRYDDNRVVFNRWCVSGYGVAPDAFLARAVEAAGGYYFCPDFKPDAQALAEADRQQAANTSDALAERQRLAEVRERRDAEWVQAMEARRAAVWESLQVVLMYDKATGVEHYRWDPYEEEPDASQLAPVA